MIYNGEGKPVVALDIDGTLGDYHGHFLNFATNWFGREFPDPCKINPGRPLHEFMGIDKRDYRDAKLAYRQGGWKRWMPAYENAAWLTRMIRHMGADVWICTTRPYLRLDNIDPDTREWLDRNRIEYDGVIFDTLEGKGSKYDELKRQAGTRVASVVDDLPEMMEKVQSIQLMGCQSAILRDQPYNRYLDWSRRAGSMFEVWGHVQRDILTWNRVKEESVV